jgi:hypothetical protein
VDSLRTGINAVKRKSSGGQTRYNARRQTSKVLVRAIESATPSKAGKSSSMVVNVAKQVVSDVQSQWMQQGHPCIILHVQKFRLIDRYSKGDGHRYSRCGGFL